MDIAGLRNSVKPMENSNLKLKYLTENSAWHILCSRPEMCPLEETDVYFGQGPV
jgi:hypothetical protein